MALGKGQEYHYRSRTVSLSGGSPEQKVSAGFVLLCFGEGEMGVQREEKGKELGVENTEN